MLKKFAYFKPRSMKEAMKLLEAPGAAVHAGGTDLLGCLRDGAFHADRIVSLGGLPNLKGIKPMVDGGLQIGAMTTIAEVSENGSIRGKYPVLAEAAASVASPQIRNQGTIGGNICQRPRCWYFRGNFSCLRKGGACSAHSGLNQYHAIFGAENCYYVHPSDTAPALVALNALVTITGPKGARTIPVDSFFMRPSQDPTKETVLEQGELVTAITLPAPEAGAKSTYRKIRERASWDFAIAGVAAVLHMDGPVVRKATLVLSGVAATPWPAADAENVLAGRRLNSETANAVGEAAVKGAEPLEHNGYKIPLVRGLLYQTLLSL